MTNNQIGLLTTFILGIFILIGASISLLVNKKSKITSFSIGLAFGVIVTLIITDLMPEIVESLGVKKIYLFGFFSVVGFTILKIFDNFIPDHNSNHHMSNTESNANLEHIGIMTTLAIILHNIIEGMAVYSTALKDGSLAVSLAIGVGFHNIPLGMVIASSLYNSNKNLFKTIIIILIVSLSTFCGGLIMYLFNFTNVNETVLGCLLSLTLGMLVFIVVDELYSKIRDTKEKSITYTGIVIGILLIIISTII